MGNWEAKERTAKQSIASRLKGQWEHDSFSYLMLYIILNIFPKNSVWGNLTFEDSLCPQKEAFDSMCGYGWSHSHTLPAHCKKTVRVDLLVGV